MKNARRILSKGSNTVKGLMVLVEKAEFSKEFRCKFHSDGEGDAATQLAIQLQQERIQVMHSLCFFVLLNRYWGIVLYGPGASS